MCIRDRGIKTATGQDKWHSTVIDKMLRNEKYMGDALLQKSYTVDFMMISAQLRSLFWELLQRTAVEPLKK